LNGIPVWIKKYAASICKYIDFEQEELPKILSLKAQKKEKGFDAFINHQNAVEEAKGLKYVRLSNLVITLNKINLFFRHPPNKNLMHLPLFKVFNDKDLIDKLWFDANSIISDLYLFIALYEGENHPILQQINQYRSKLNIIKNKQQSNQYLLELRQKLIELPSKCNAYHHGAADILLFYASTKYFFYFYPPFQGFQSRVFTYKELGYQQNGCPPPKKYGQQFVWGQLNFWERHQPSTETIDCSLNIAKKGTMQLPNIKCCYSSKIRKKYDYDTRKQLIHHLIHKNYKPWSSKFHFSFKNNKLYGSPWLDCYIDDDSKSFIQMIQTMKNTKIIYPDGTFMAIQEEEEEEKEREELKGRRSDRLKGKVSKNYKEPNVE